MGAADPARPESEVQHDGCVGAGENLDIGFGILSRGLAPPLMNLTRHQARMRGNN